MGLLDWIRQRMGRTSWEDVADDAESPAPAEPPAPKAVAKAARADAGAPASSEAPPKPKKKPKTKAKGKRKSRKKRKGTAPSPMATLPKPKAHSVDAEVLTVEEAERKYGPVIAAVEERLADAPTDEVPRPEEARSPEPPRRRDDRERPPREDPDAYRAWVVAPQLEALLERADEALADEAPTREGLRKALRALRDDWSRVGPAPADRPDLAKAAKERAEALGAKIASIPDPMDEERQRHAEAKRALIAEVEALSAVEDVRVAIDRVRELQQQWRDVGMVAREDVAPLRTAWKKACDEVYARREADRLERAERQQRLVKTAEALSVARDPDAAAERMKGLQAEWKAVGSIGRGEEADALWAAFRAAADAVLERRRTARAESEAANLEKKEALIARAMALAEEGVEDPESIIDAMQRDWRKIGHVPREHSDRLWQAFRDACQRLKSPPPVAQELLGDGDGLSFNPFAGLAHAPDDE